MCQTFIHPILNIRYMYFNLASTVIFREHRDHRARWSFGFPQYPITNPSLSSTCIMNLSGELSNLSLSTHLRFAALKFSGGFKGPFTRATYLMMLLWDFITWNIYNWSTPSHPPKGENRNWNRSKNRSCKRALRQQNGGVCSESSDYHTQHDFLHCTSRLKTLTRVGFELGTRI
jgi:hypothetical protein